jgi:hypothetical protein
MQRHRQQEFIRFLNAIEAQGLVQKSIRHPRRTFRFTPASASWLNAVEGFFANSRRGDGNAVYLSRLSICKRLSIASSSNTMPNRKPSHGLLIQTRHQVLDSVHYGRVWAETVQLGFNAFRNACPYPGVCRK